MTTTQTALDAYVRELVASSPALSAEHVEMIRDLMPAEEEAAA